MRILLWHGWLLEGTGSNVYTAKVAEAYRRAGHDVLLLCQEGHAERFPFIDAAGTVGREGLSWDSGSSARVGRGRIRLVRPRIGRLLPVFVLDEYEGFQVKRFVELTDDELAGYLNANVAALRAAAEDFRPDVAIVGHAIPGAVIARRALGADTYVAKIHGSDLEYAIRQDRRYRHLAREGLGGAIAITGATDDVLARTVQLVPDIAVRMLVIPPGVEVELFQPASRAGALRSAAHRLNEEESSTRGRPDSLDDEVAIALDRRDADALDELARRYDHSVPDPGAAGRLAGLVGHEGPLVGYLGKLIPQKGVDVLLQALAILDPRPPALLVGFGTHREWLIAFVFALDRGDPGAVAWVGGRAELPPELTPEEVARARGLRADVTFTGRLDHRFAPQVLAALDVLVVPSILHEAFGMVAVEGAAAGAMPLVARHSGLAEVAGALEDAVGRPGLFSYPGGPGGVHRLARALDRLLSLPAEERAELRQAASAFASREWTWERTADRLLGAAGRTIEP